MKRALYLICFCLTFFPSYSQIIFLEDFDGVGGPTAGGAGTYSFPAGWLKANVDNLTPAGSVSYVNEAWERREDFNFSVVDSCAFSTSWYTPAGMADDWMWTPAIAVIDNCIVSWNAVTYDETYPDGYEVRIMVAPNVPNGGTGVIGNMLSASTQIFAIAAENSAWTARSVSLAAYEDSTVYIGFRNNSSDKFLLLIDDVKVERLVEYDAQILSTNTQEYTQIPASQEYPFSFSANVRSSGTEAITNVTLHVNVYDESNVNVYSAMSAAFPSLSSGATTNLSTIGTFSTDIAGTYRFHYGVMISETDQMPENDSLSRYMVLSETVYARDDGAQTGNLGIGAGNGGYLGQEFAITAESTLSSFSIYSDSWFGSSEMGAAIFQIVGGTPEDVPIYTAMPIVIPGESPGQWYEFVIPGGFPLSAGDTIMIAGQEIDSTLRIAQTNTIFTPGAIWVDWPSNPFGDWANVEQFGAGFSKPFMIRANFDPATCDDGIQNGDEEGVDCGGSCGPCPPPTAICGVVTVYVNSGSPVYDGPGTSNIWWIPAEDLDAGSTSAYMSPNLDIRRHLSTITFDWTTMGACIDASPNGGALSTADKGTVYRDCLPVRNADFNLWKMYQLRIQDPAGTGTCIGLVRVIPQAGGSSNLATPVFHYTLADERLEHYVETNYAEDLGRVSEFTISPNPGSDFLSMKWLSLTDNKVSVRISGITGQVFVSQVVEALPGTNWIEFDMSAFAPGIYVITLESEGVTEVRKWIKAN